MVNGYIQLWTLLLVYLLPQVSYASYSCAPIDYFRFAKARGEGEKKLLSNNDNFKKWRVNLNIVDPTDRSEFPMVFDLYQHQDNAPRPVVLIIPAIVGANPLDKFAARYFISKGAHAVIVRPIFNPTEYETPMKEFQKIYLRSMATITGTVDYLLGQKDFGVSKITLWATSLGSIMTSISFSLDKRIEKAVFIVGGGDIPDIMSKSKNYFVRKYRKIRMREEKIPTVEAYRKRFQELLDFDPLCYGDLRDPEDTYMVMSLDDSNVPTPNQLLFAQSYRSQKRFVLRLGHLATSIRAHTKPYINQLAKFLLE